MSARLETELTLYFTEDVEAEDVDPVMWWKANEPRYPKMAKQARRYLAVPGTSIPSERVFSISGPVVSKHRCSLAHSNVDALVFLCKNSFLKQAVTCTVVPAQTDGVPSAVASATDVEEELEPPLPQLMADQVSDSDDEKIVLSD